MIGQINVVMIGFKLSEVPVVEGIRFTVFVSNEEEKSSGREKYLFIKRLGSTCDILVYNSSKSMDDYEVIMLDTVYSNNIPVFAVGESVTCSEIVYSLKSNEFDTLKDAVNHIAENYL